MNLQASSIIELIVSMLILSIIIVIGMETLVNIQSQSSNLISLKSQMEVPYIINEIKKGNKVEFESKEFSINFSVLKFNDSDKIKHIHLEVVRSDGTIILNHDELWFTSQ
jgi:hypothetical protein